MAEAQIDLSVGTVGDAYKDDLAECVIGQFKAEDIYQVGPLTSMRKVEWETLKWPCGDASIAYRLTGQLVGQPLAGSLEPVAIIRDTFLGPSDTSPPSKQRWGSM